MFLYPANPHSHICWSHTHTQKDKWHSVLTPMLPCLSFTSANTSKMKSISCIPQLQLSSELWQTDQTNGKNRMFTDFSVVVVPYIHSLSSPYRSKAPDTLSGAEMDNTSRLGNRLTDWRGGPGKHTLTWNGYLNNTFPPLPHRTFTPFATPHHQPCLNNSPCKFSPPVALASTFDHMPWPDGASDYAYDLWPQESQSISKQELEGEDAISLIGCVINTLV